MDPKQRPAWSPFLTTEFAIAAQSRQTLHARMNASPSFAELEDGLPGLQLAVFEVVWPAVPAIEALYVRSGPESVEVYCHSNTPLGLEDREASAGLLLEVFESSPLGQCNVQFGLEAPGADYRVLMTAALFRTIAIEVSPWRLKVGR